MVPARVAGLDKEGSMVGRKRDKEGKGTCFCLIQSLLQYTFTLTPRLFRFTPPATQCKREHKEGEEIRQLVQCIVEGNMGVGRP